MSACRNDLRPRPMAPSSELLLLLFSTPAAALVAAAGVAGAADAVAADGCVPSDRAANWPAREPDADETETVLADTAGDGCSNSWAVPWPVDVVDAEADGDGDGERLPPAAPSVRLPVEPLLG